jgi:hypothetical protein
VALPIDTDLPTPDDINDDGKPKAGEPGKAKPQ